MKFRICAVVALTLGLSLVTKNDVSAQESNRDQVRAKNSEGGWHVVYGELVNEAEYAKLAASLATGSTGAYFSDYLSRTQEKLLRSFREIGRQALLDGVKRALRDVHRQLGSLATARTVILTRPSFLY